MHINDKVLILRIRRNYKSIKRNNPIENGQSTWRYSIPPVIMEKYKSKEMPFHIYPDDW